MVVHCFPLLVTFSQPLSLLHSFPLDEPSIITTMMLPLLAVPRRARCFFIQMRRLLILLRGVSFDFLFSPRFSLSFYASQPFSLGPLHITDRHRPGCGFFGHHVFLAH